MQFKYMILRLLNYLCLFKVIFQTLIFGFTTIGISLEP